MTRRAAASVEIVLRPEGNGCRQNAPTRPCAGGKRAQAPETAQPSISSQTACSSCSSQSAPGSAIAQLVHVPVGRAGAVLTLGRTNMPGETSTADRSGAIVIPQCVGGSPGPMESETPGARSALNQSAWALALPWSRTGNRVSAS